MSIPPTRKFPLDFTNSLIFNNQTTNTKRPTEMKFSTTRDQSAGVPDTDVIPLSQATLKVRTSYSKIKKAWKEGGIIDQRGNIWLEMGSLEKVVKIPYIVEINKFRPRPSDTLFIEDTQYLRGGKVAEMIYAIVTHYERTHQGRRPAEKASLAIYHAARNAPEAKKRQLRCLALYEDLRKLLKDRRIREFSLKNDEITGEPLSSDCEFCYVRAPWLYDELSNEAFNGLVVNAETYQKIRNAHCATERDLFKFFDKPEHKSDWLIDWFQSYGRNLKVFRANPETEPAHGIVS